MTIIQETPYLNLLQQVLDEGDDRGDRTGTGTKTVFGAQMRFDLSKGFPAVTTKKLAFKTMTTELLWFIGGFTDVKMLQDNKCKIWNEWIKEDGTIGPGYGKQWRSWGTGSKETVDQLGDVVSQIQKNPNSRRHIVSAWNPGELDEMALPPCHLLFQFDVSSDNKLSCQLYQRSADLLLGIPFNFASYALLTHIIADICGLAVGDLVHTIGNAHIYNNHIDQVKEQLSRDPFPSPTLVMPPRGTCIDDYALGKMYSSDFSLQDYNHHAAIKAPVAV